MAVERSGLIHQFFRPLWLIRLTGRNAVPASFVPEYYEVAQFADTDGIAVVILIAALCCPNGPYLQSLFEFYGLVGYHRATSFQRQASGCNADQRPHFQQFSATLVWQLYEWLPSIQRLSTSLLGDGKTCRTNMWVVYPHRVRVRVRTDQSDPSPYHQGGLCGGHLIVHRVDCTIDDGDVIDPYLRIK
ncbi:hypothetical protein Q4610_10365 [Sphingobium sp. HBC34]|uniref:Transposase n=1 Tax=Sphingobium cyanobacteriorum TaxID=3063954 RepID=A0ABT8ZMN7_9SPHN|nr:hypothetical protein [Sphingobium sp. HBC34]MDO7835447.1 hypothetical protein [Sphingobium sp. HBC34]